MKHHVVLQELDNLKKSYKLQGFRYTQEQQARYDELLKLRRARVADLYATDRVSFGSDPIKKED
jgi:hypothetical protein